MKTVVVVQARTGSTRLPGKTLLPLRGRPLLSRMCQRVLAAKTPFELVVATTTDPADDPIVEIARAMELRCYRGHPTDLLDRHLRAAEERDAELVVKIPSDCPLIDPAVIDRVLDEAQRCGATWDYVSNLHPATWPDGNDVEALPRAVLAEAHARARAPHEREHTTPYVWERPERFRLGQVCWETGRDCSRTHRFTIDYPEDYEFVSAVYNELWSERSPVFSLEEIMELLAARPDIHALNAPYLGVTWYSRHRQELEAEGADRRRASTPRTTAGARS